MTLIDAARADEIYARMPPAVEMSGGSAGNTIAGVASLGGRAAYIGKVCDDQLGRVYRHDIRALGVTFDVPPADSGSTGRCLIVVTPDAQRTMQTYLGAGADLGPDDVDDALIASAQRDVPRGLSLGSAARQRGVPQGGVASRTMPAAACR